MSAIAFLLAAALSAGNAEFDAAAKSGAYEIAVRRAASEAAAKGPEPGRLADAMLADPATYANADRARAKAKDAYLAMVAEAAEFGRRKVAERLGIDPDASPSAVVSGADAETAAKSFDARYAAERRDACERQAKTIVSATRPTEAEVESLSDGELRDLMTDRIASEQGRAVFDENRVYISDRIVRPAIESARAEQRRQREYLMRARSEAAAPSKLSADLEARLRANVAEHGREEGPGKAWGVFPSVLSRALPEAVERRTVGRLVSQVENVRLEVSADDVARTIAADPAGHVKAADSERKFSVAYSAGALAEALAKAVDDAPAGERKELEAFLRERLGADAVAKAVERLVRRDVMPKWREVRREVARRVAEKTWPTLADGTWYPAPELADEVSARSDYAAAVAGWRALKGMEELASAGEEALAPEEAVAIADAAVAKSFDLARSAIAAQNAIVDGCHAAVLAESRARKESFWRRTPDFRTIVGMLTRAAEERWGETRIATLWPDGDAPANASDQHRELFPSVRRRIELLAKTILEEMDRPQPAPESPEEPETLGFLLRVDRAGDKLEVSLEQGGDVLGRETVPARAGDFEDAMHRMTKKLSSEVLKLK